MATETFDLNDPLFLDRAAEVRRDLDAGVPYTYGQIAEALGMDFQTFARFLAAELFRQDPSISGVVIDEVREETVQ